MYKFTDSLFQLVVNVIEALVAFFRCVCAFYGASL